MLDNSVHTEELEQNQLRNLIGDKAQHPAGWRSQLSRLLRYRIEHVGRPTAPCMACGSSAPPCLFAFRVDADFDAYHQLTPDLRPLFLQRAVGYCRDCGFPQDFARYSDEQVQEYVRVISSKDGTVSEEAYHTYPVPIDYRNSFNAKYFSKRLTAWGQAIDKAIADGVIPGAPKKVLFLRPFFGAAPRFFLERYAPQCSAMEISAVARRTVEDELPQVKFLEGNIHASFFGDFLKSGPYDAIVAFHTLVHAIDVQKSLRQLKSLLAPNGFMIFTHEINVKPHNPFHMVFAGEERWRRLFASHFPTVLRLDNCEDGPPPHVAKFTNDGTCPDYLVVNNGKSGSSSA